MHEIDGLWRIRFLTSHPNYMTDRILHAVRDLPKVCEHIEVPIQAGLDALLERMKRGYTQADYRALVERIRPSSPTSPSTPTSSSVSAAKRMSTSTRP